MKFKKVKAIAIGCILIVICLGASVALFKTPRMVLLKVANTRPISTIINRLQHFTIPLNNAECLNQLKQLDVDFLIQADFDEPGGCRVENAVRLSRVGQLRIDNAPLLSCSMAIQLSEFERDTLQPTAQRIFRSEVSRMKHLGTYNCRGMRQFSRILSQHAFANAIDVSGFVMKDGQSISVKKDWKPTGSKSQFLKEVSSAACDTFRVAVSPDGDANHWNHLHWDVGLYKNCR